MTPNLSQLIKALPEGLHNDASAEAHVFPEAIARMSLRPVPIGRFRRMTALVTAEGDGT